MPRKGTPQYPSKSTEYRRTHDYQHVPIRQRLIFAKEYIRTGNATAAWKAAFPQSVAGYAAQRASACKMLHAPKTKELIDKLSEKARRRISTSLEEIVADAVNVLRFDPARIFDNGKLRPWEEIEPEDRRCITEVNITETTSIDGEVIRKTTVKAARKDTARDQLAKMMGAYARDNAQKAAVAAVAASPVDPLSFAQRLAFLLNEGMRASKGQQVITQQPAIEHKQ